MEKHMKVKFLQDFQGVETNGVFYAKDSEHELPDNVASRLVDDGRAEYVAARGVESHNVEPQFEQPEPPKRKRKQ
jgi:hypothetical protein